MFYRWLTQTEQLLMKALLLSDVSNTLHWLQFGKYCILHLYTEKVINNIPLASPGLVGEVYAPAGGQARQRRWGWHEGRGPHSWQGCEQDWLGGGGRTWRGCPPKGKVYLPGDCGHCAPRPVPIILQNYNQKWTNKGWVINKICSRTNYRIIICQIACSR
jgi:hypothetical protein